VCDVATTFNLVDEPWLPCLDLSGNQQAVSLREALTRAHELREVFHASPLVVASLYRLLLAVVHRALGPRGIDGWRALWEAGRFEAAAVNGYLDEWRHRFDLFDPDRPFYQVPSLPEPLARPVQRLCHERTRGNNLTLHDHTLDAFPVTLEAGQAACYLVTLQAFDMGGLQTRQPGEKPSAEAAPLVKSAVVVLRGPTVFHTLLLNWDSREVRPGTAGPDVPAWERDELPGAGSRYPAGWVDLFTWQSRRVLLLPEMRDGRPVVRSAVVMRGESFPQNLLVKDHERMVAYRQVEKARPGQAPWLPVGFQEGRAAWRDSTTWLVRGSQGVDSPPRTLEWVAELTLSGALDIDFVPALDLIGMVSSQAKVLLWRREWLPVPPAYLSQPTLVERLQEELDRAEMVAERALSAALRRLEKELIKPDREGPLHKEQLDPLRRLEEQGARTYWSILEHEFKPFMDELANGQGNRTKWIEVLRRAARDAFREQVRGLTESRRSLRAVALGEQVLNGQLVRLLHSEQYGEVANVT
jgi:CRISPR system Cascade subunit CasA